MPPCASRPIDDGLHLSGSLIGHRLQKNRQAFWVGRRHDQRDASSVRRPDGPRGGGRCEPRLERHRPGLAPTAKRPLVAARTQRRQSRAGHSSVEPARRKTTNRTRRGNARDLVSPFREFAQPISVNTPASRVAEQTRTSNGRSRGGDKPSTRCSERLGKLNAAARSKTQGTPRHHFIRRIDS
jgi:hypothetical protein